jgi:hypothetical protein
VNEKASSAVENPNEVADSHPEKSATIKQDFVINIKMSHRMRPCDMKEKGEFSTQDWIAELIPKRSSLRFIREIAQYNAVAL